MSTPVYYSAETTGIMVANGSITNNPVFYYPGTQMDNPNATQDDIWFALAEYFNSEEKDTNLEDEYTVQKSMRKIQDREKSKIAMRRPTKRIAKSFVWIEQGTESW